MQRPNSASSANNNRGPANGMNAGGMNNNHGMNNAHGANNPASANANHGANNTNIHSANNNSHGPNSAGIHAGGGSNSSRSPTIAHRGPPTTTRELKTHSGASVQANYRGGHVRSIQAHGVKVERTTHGARHVETVHNGRRVVAMGGHRGYMERPYLNRNGRTYVQRTYVPTL